MLHKVTCCPMMNTIMMIVNDPAGLPRGARFLVLGKDQVLHDAHNICMTKIMIMICNRLA
jgi:hypothetical protein